MSRVVRHVATDLVERTTDNVPILFEIKAGDVTVKRMQRYMEIWNGGPWS